jgi:predicted DsbA family dithiol-disulfide isomerase
VFTWLESIEAKIPGGLSTEWKAFSLDQQNSQESPGFLMWEHPDHPSQGVPALVAGRAAKKQGAELFLRFHRAAFSARHDQGKDISHGEVLKEIAGESGLDPVRFDRDMRERQVWQAMGEEHLDAKRKYDVFGVPTLVFEKGHTLFVKLKAIPDTEKERISLFGLIHEMATRKPYLRELKRP